MLAGPVLLPIWPYSVDVGSLQAHSQSVKYETYELVVLFYRYASAAADWLLQQCWLDVLSKLPVIPREST
jgi:hypothetical protein